MARRQIGKAAGPAVRPIPMKNSLTASSQRITSGTVSRASLRTEGWQDEAWDMFSLVGELQTLAMKISKQVGKVKFFVGKVAEDPLDAPEPVESGLPSEILKVLGGSDKALRQRITRLATNLYVAGDGYLVGIPRTMLPEAAETDPTQGAFTPGMPVEDGSVDLSDMEWRIVSVKEIHRETGNDLSIDLGDGVTVSGKLSDFFIVRVWNPHPEKAWRAHSSMEASLPILREIVGLTMYISSQVDSRLAGSGLLWVPSEISRAIKIGAGLEPDDDADPFIESLIESMTTPIKDRESVSAVVPLPVTAPKDAIDAVRHQTFETELTSEVKDMREAAIRRLATSQDAPPELLLGTADVNHWGAWLIQEDTVNSHVEPPAALIADALTTQLVWPILEESGMETQEARKYVVSYRVGHLVARPNKTQDAMTLNERGAVGGEALREAADFSDEDKPTIRERVMDLVMRDPSLLHSPGAAELYAQLEAVQGGEDDKDTPITIAPTQESTEAHQSPQNPGTAPTPPPPAGDGVPVGGNPVQ